MLKHPSAWLPIAMSAAAVALVLGYVGIFGVQEPQADEGMAARIFQLLLVAQLPIMAYFGATQLPRHTKEALWVLGGHILAISGALGLVFLLEI